MRMPPLKARSHFSPALPGHPSRSLRTDGAHHTFTLSKSTRDLKKGDLYLRFSVLYIWWFKTQDKNTPQKPW